MSKVKDYIYRPEFECMTRSEMENLQSERLRKTVELVYNNCKPYRAKMDEFKISDALGEIFSFLRRCNKYIDETAPWVLAKDEAKKGRLATVLYNLAAGIQVAAALLQPFMPETAEKIARQFSCPLRAYDSLGDFALPAGAHVSEPVQHLFARRSYKEIEEQYDALHAAKAAKDTKAAESGNAQPSKPEAEAKAEKPAPKKESKGHKANFPAEISIDDFAKVKMQVAEVIACEKVPKADKLLKSTVKIGEETRTVVSGIAQYYTPEQMVGRKVIMVTNLKPAKLRGIVSEGMILCAEDAEGNLQLLAPAGDIGSGSTVY